MSFDVSHVLAELSANLSQSDSNWAIMVFIVAWMFVVYFPLAHMVWGIDGLMNGVSAVGWLVRVQRWQRIS